VQPQRAARRQVRGKQRHHEQHECASSKRHYIQRAGLEEQALHETRQQNCATQSDRDSGAHEADTGVATIVFGAVIELEQGATRTGNCELHDLIPDAIGAFVASVLVLSWQRLRHR
jgi:hypothetical protein